ncbi:MAG: DUF4276 family protein [Chloroflexi bacterium]|nr:DUF4276 family protein [Chloroflexota bacterium]
MLFSDPSKLASVLRRPDLSKQFWPIWNVFDTHVHIDDSPASAPSKRLQQPFPRSRKVQMGERAARAKTLQRIRRECPLLNDWLSKLERLPPPPA